MQNSLLNPARISSHPRLLGSLSVLAAAVLLSACGTTPLPPWQPSGAPAPKGQAVQVQRGTVVSAPVVSTPAPQAVVSPLEARFPAPNIQYSTPGLNEGRRTFSSNTEVEQWLQTQAQAVNRTGNRTKAAVLNVGTSQRGANIKALLLSRAADLTPASLEAHARPTVLLVGQQHGNDAASAEALLVVARELSSGLLEPLLERVNVIVLPRANPDGADGQTALTANGVDLAHDHLKLATPEARSLAILTRDFRPILTIDVNEFVAVGAYPAKLGAVPAEDVMVQYTNTANSPEFFAKAAQEWFVEPMLDAFRTQGLRASSFYTTSAQMQDKRLTGGDLHADVLRNANGLKNAVALSLSSRGSDLGRQNLQRRVHALVIGVSTALRNTAERSADLEQVRSFVVRDTTAKSCNGSLAVETTPTFTQRSLTMLDPATGADRVVEVNWGGAPLKTTLSRQRPCGYWVSSYSDGAVKKLQMMGVQVMRVAESGVLLADTYLPTAPVAGRGPGEVSPVQLQRASQDAPAGSYYISLNQPLSALISAALEPDTSTSFYNQQVLSNLQESARVMAPPSLIFEDGD